MNGDGAPTVVERLGDDIVVWPAPDEDTWTSTGSPAATVVPVTAESVDGDEAVSGFESAGVAIHRSPLHSRRAQATTAVGDRLGHRGPRGRTPSVGRLGTDAAGRDEGPAHVPPASDRTPAMATDSQLLETDAVARRVVNSLHLRESPEAFASSYSGTALSDDLLGVSASASSSSDAVRRANALAHEYLAYRADIYQHQSNAIIEGLQKRQAAIQDQIAELDRQLRAQETAITSTDPAIGGRLSSGGQASTTSSPR